MSNREKRQQKLVEQWNENHPIGTRVMLYGTIDKRYPIGETKSRTKAQLLQSHTAVVWVDNHPDCVSLEALEVLE